MPRKPFPRDHDSAEIILLRAGLQPTRTNLIRFAADHIDWRPAGHLFVAFHNKQTADQQVILHELLDEGLVTDHRGKYHDDYCAAGALNTLLTTQLKQKAEEIAHKAHYASPKDYVASLAEWEKTGDRSRHYRLPITATQSPDTRIVTAALLHTGSIDYCHGHRFQAQGTLKEILKTMDKLLTQAKEQLDPPGRGSGR